MKVTLNFPRPPSVHIASSIREMSDGLDMGFAKHAAIHQFKAVCRKLMGVTNDLDLAYRLASTIITKYQHTLEDAQDIIMEVELDTQLSPNQELRNICEQLVKTLEILCHGDHDQGYVQELQTWLDKFKSGGVKRKGDTELETIHDHVTRITESGRQVAVIRTQEHPEPPVAYIYDSKHGNPSVRLNTIVDTMYGKKIDCGPLSFWFLQNHKNYQAALSTLQTRQPQSLAENNFGRDRVDFRADQYIVFKLDALFAVLSDLCEDMEVGDVKTLLFQSESHMMAIVVEYKRANYFSIRVYDPNFTAIHSRVLVENMDNLRCLTIHDILPVGIPERYFRSFQVGMLGVYDNPHNLEPELSELSIQWVNDSLSVQDIAGYLFFGLGHNGMTIVEPMLQHVTRMTNKNDVMRVFLSENEYGTTGLMRAMSHGFCAVVEPLIKCVLELQLLSEPKKVAILLATRKRGQSGLAQAAYRNNIELVAMFFEIVLESNLSSQSKSDLLGQALFVAMQLSHLEVVERIMNFILSSNLLDGDVVRLLAAMDLREDDGGIGLFDAIENNRFAVAQLFINTLLNSNLSDEHKFILLDKAILIAMCAGHMYLLSCIIDCIFSSGSSQELKVRLLIVLNERDIPRLAIEMFNNNVRVVTIYVQKILSSNLSPANKILLLKAIHRQNTLSITPGLQNNSCDAVKQYVTLIATSTTLDKDAKLAILTIPEELLVSIGTQGNAELIQWYRAQLAQVV